MSASDQLAPATTAADVPDAGRAVGVPLIASDAPAWVRGTAVGFVVVFAALLASFPARNSDLWMHLVRGRQVAYAQPGTTGGLEIVSGNLPYPTWLYDLLCYGVYSGLGGVGLAVAKVLLVVALALVVLQLSRRGAGWGLAAACTALALLAMSTRLQMQPATVSLLFLALTVYLVGPDPPPVKHLRAIALPVLFLLWPGMDRGFIIGLGVAALAWLGYALDTPSRPARPGAQRMLSIAFLALLAGFYALYVRGPLVPAEVAPGGSPVQRPYLEAMLRSPAGLAYFALLVLGAFSFRAAPTLWSWQRFLPWLGLALLSVWNIRAIALFAVVGAPALAWNLRALPATARPARGLGLLAVLAAITLLVFAWPGWLQPPPFEPRAWTVDLPPAPERAAAAVQRWRDQQVGREQRTLHLTPETAYAFAWHIPEQAGVLDDQLAAAIRSGTDEPASWLEQLRAAHIDHVIVYDLDRERLLATLERLMREPEQWPLLYLQGDLAIFGWRDPAVRQSGGPDPFAERRLDLNRLAFHPERDKRAPRKPSDRAAPEQSWWDSFSRPAAAPSSDHDEAMLYLLHAEALAHAAPYRRGIAWQAGQGAALVAATGGCGVPQLPVDSALHLALVQPPPVQDDGRLPPLGQVVATWQKGFTKGCDDVPPAVLYLAIRAARRAVAANPNDAQAYLVLGESYLRLLYGTRERLWGHRLEELVQLRRTQASAALNRAVTLDPKLAQAHISLARLYQDILYFDLALEHLRAYQKLLRPADPAADAVGQAVTRLSDAVAEHEAAYEAEASSPRVVDRALAAYRHGLAARARDILLESNVAAFGPQGLRLELELLLRTGRWSEVAQWTSPEQKASMGGATYHWLRIQALASAGDYARAAEECDQLADDARGAEPLEPWQTIAALVAQTVLDEQPVGATAGSLAWRSISQLKMINRTLSLAKDLRQVANARVFRGLVALEEGNMDEAEVSFRLALAFWQDDDAGATGAGIDFNARPVAEAALPWIVDQAQR